MGELINLIDCEEFNYLLTNDKFSTWLFNNDKPLALTYLVPAMDQYFDYQDMKFCKLSARMPLSKNANGRTRTFMFSKDSCVMQQGSLEPYGLFRSQMQFQVHRRG